MVSRFVVLSMPRTGSNMLVSLLDGHPAISCFGELMRKTPQWMREQGYRGALRNLEYVDPRFREDAVRFAEPRAFVDAVIAARAATAETVGCKLMLNQHPAYLAELVDDPCYAKILLHRANPLAVYSSGKIAKATGQGTARKGTVVKRAKVPFDKAEFQRFLSSHRRLYSDVRRRLAASGTAHLEVEYLDLIGGHAVPEIVAFLGADPAQALQPETIKRNPSDLLERFDNPDDVRAALKEMNAEEWTVEHRAPAEAKA